jgi:hypothetical protein
MAAERKGTLSVIDLVSRVVIFTSLGSTCEYAGRRSTSSKVKPSPKNLPGYLSLGDFIVAMCKDRGIWIRFPWAQARER